MLNQIEKITVNEESLELCELKSIVDNFIKDSPDKFREIFQMSREQS